MVKAQEEAYANAQEKARPNKANARNIQSKDEAKAKQNANHLTNHVFFLIWQVVCVFYLEIFCVIYLVIRVSFIWQVIFVFLFGKLRVSFIWQIAFVIYLAN